MIDGNEIVKLMCKPMSDENVLNMMVGLGMKVPLLDETYELEEVASTESSDEMIIFDFEEIDGYTQDGDPCLSMIEFQESKLASLPFQLLYTDGYETCCKNIGIDGDLKNDMDITGRSWELTVNEVEIEVIIYFTNKALKSIKFIKIFENN